MWNRAGSVRQRGQLLGDLADQRAERRALGTHVVGHRRRRDALREARIGDERRAAVGDPRDRPAHAQHDAEWGASIVSYSRKHPVKLEHTLLETEMLRRRVPGLILDARNEPRAHRPMVDITETTSYVAAPIAPEGRVIGMVHADLHHTGRQVDVADRDVLWTFAEGFGYAVQCAVLGERLRRAADAAATAPASSADELLGPVDALKLRSSMTLFLQAADGDAAEGFTAVLDRWYGGEPDPATVALLAAEREADRPTPARPADA